MGLFDAPHLKVRKLVPPDRRHLLDSVEEFSLSALPAGDPNLESWRLALICAAWCTLNNGEPYFPKLHENDYAKIQAIYKKSLRKLGAEAYPCFVVLEEMADQGWVPASFKSVIKMSGLNLLG